MIPTQLKALAVRCETPLLHHVFEGAWTDRLCLIAATRTCSLAREASVTCSSPRKVRHVPAPPLAEAIESEQQELCEERS